MVAGITRRPPWQSPSPHQQPITREVTIMPVYWLHVFHALLHGYAHIHSARGLYHYYLHHHAVAFLRSGITSGSGGRDYLWWLTVHHVSPADW